MTEIFEKINILGIRPRTLRRRCNRASPSRHPPPSRRPIARHKRRVSFNPVATILGEKMVETKTHDGINTQNYWFDRLIEGFFVCGENKLFPDISDVNSLRAFLKPCPNEIIPKLRVQVIDLIRRVSFEGKAMILPKGGGNAGKVDNSHIPTLQWLLANFPQKIATTVMDKKNQARVEAASS